MLGPVYINLPRHSHTCVPVHSTALHWFKRAAEVQNDASGMQVELVTQKKYQLNGIVGLTRADGVSNFNGDC
jgi:hypothetical protein